jgi:predicted dithiol-disulfide oxidoreductase (DUF899 family)
VSRAPLAKLLAYRQRMGWSFPWVSSFGRDFNFAFNVSLTEEQQRGGTVEYNYRREPPYADAERPAYSARAETRVDDLSAAAQTRIRDRDRDLSALSIGKRNGA